MRDPITQSIYNDLKKGIELTLKSDCPISALSLIFCGIDVLANLGRPASSASVNASDFILWAERFLKLPGKVAVTGEEWYSARCAVLHTLGVESRRTRSGTARKVAFVLGGHPPVRFNPAIDKTLILVDIRALAKSFFGGIDLFLVGAFASSEKRKIVEERLKGLLISLPGRREEAPGTQNREF